GLTQNIHKFRDFKTFLCVGLRKSYIIKDDPDDNEILECDLCDKADYIVSRDSHLLDLKECHSIKIVRT
ncbi:MAG: hypothetical protein QMD06_02870, partial [Candidatus Altarchaeum sp.]|nr:hypothetical protein [Candidatus Altarchaeum sp.]